ncbi:MAG: F0F1 ATP synthase subunit delta [Lachnospiraceae bacterium]|nr:F0F1 ATP synthase subunit delta [Lachnospiraceae bacterium]
MAKLVSKTYGEALFELVLEKGTMDEALEELNGVLGVLKEHGELDQLLTHPKISKEEKISVMEQVFKGRISDDVLGFLLILIEKDRYTELPAVAEYFISQVREYKNIGTAQVTSAFPVTEEQKKQIEEKLLSTTDYTAFEMEYQTDPSLIGGVIIRIGDRVVDGSVRNKLAKLAQSVSA